MRPRVALGPIKRDELPERVFNIAALPTVEATARDTLVQAFVRWYSWGGLGIVLVALAASGLVGCLRILWDLHRASRAGTIDLGVRELTVRSSGRSPA
jgi:hypothetical protein